MEFQPSIHSNPGIRAGAGPATGQYYVQLSGERGMSPDGWHWGILLGRVPETVKIKGPLVPGQRVKFKRLWKDKSVQWAILKDRKVMPQHAATPGLPAATGMPGPGMVGFDAYSMHPGVRVAVPPASSFHTNPKMVQLALPQGGLVQPRGDSSSAALGSVLGLSVLAGGIIIGDFIVFPLILKAFVPDWSYGRRVAASLGFSIVVGALTSVARAVGGQE